MAAISNVTVIGFRKETDSLGEVNVPIVNLWGAQTQRSLEHFSIGHDLIPPEMMDGASRSHLAITLSTPGSAGSGTNPEQLFAAGWSACFEGAMGIAARRMRITLPSDLAIDAEVDLCTTAGDYFLQARLNVRVPGVVREVAQNLVDAAHQTCPYSKAIRGNVDVVINLV
jgi:lipoyl-dependent peroxiredoxin